MYTILIVDDEANLLEVLAVALENMGYGTVTAETAEEALAVLEEREVHLVLSDLRLPGLSGRELMEKVKAANPDLPVVIMTAYASLKEAVEIIKEGAFDYTVKPFELDALEATIASALRYYALGRDNRDLREQLQTASAGQFVGQSPAYLALLRNVREVSASSANVLITGESGTGKEVVAKAIHYGGPRAKAPLVTINCAAIPEQLLESELFGYVKGAFTGAERERKGLIDQANDSILFLDEIHRLSPEGQEKLFLLMDQGTYSRLGQTEQEHHANVLIIGATTENPSEVMLHTFLRRMTAQIALPSLRERTIYERLQLVIFFLWKESKNIRLRISIHSTVFNALCSYECSANIGQLSSDIKLACANAYFDYLSAVSPSMHVQLRHLTEQVRNGLYTIPTANNKLLDSILKNEQMTIDGACFFEQNLQNCIREHDDIWFSASISSANG